MFGSLRHLHRPANCLPMVLNQASVFEKLAGLDEALQACLINRPLERVPEIPKRDISYLPINLCVGRIGIGSPEGQQKLLHDLANIELQAMELGLRTLMEFAWTPLEFKEQLVVVIQEEAKHLKMCLQALDSLGGYWGQWPVHLGLWHATHEKDSLLDRLFIVHRYLEGSGLDAGDTLLRRLGGVRSKIIRNTLQTIVDEEVGHVDFGSRWFRLYMEEFKVDHQAFLKRLLPILVERHPRRDKFSVELRLQAGFTLEELNLIEEHRNPTSGLGLTP